MHIEFVACHEATSQVIRLRNIIMKLKVIDSILRYVAVSVFQE